MRYDSITEAIGNTPLVRIDPSVHGLRHLDLYAKLELLNPFGSVKDRAAWAMVAPHLHAARADGATVVELSSGNTAKALAGPTGGAAYSGAVRHLRTVDDELDAAAAAEQPVRRQRAVFVVCDRVESYLSYIRDRRPDLLNRPDHAHSVRTVTDAVACRSPLGNRYCSPARWGNGPVDTLPCSPEWATRTPAPSRSTSPQAGPWTSRVRGHEA